MTLTTTIDLTALLILALATYRLARFFIEDHLFSPIRDRIWKRFPPESTKIGYLFTCYWCSSIWLGSLLTVSYILFGGWALLVCLPFALSAVAGFISTRL